MVLEAHTREHVESRVRAGLLEQNTVDLLSELGVSERLGREGLVHEGICLRRPGATDRIDIAGLTGRRITIYGQQEVVKDLIAARLARREARSTSRHARTRSRGSTATGRRIRFQAGDETEELNCDFVAGCDGFHGISRQSVAAGGAGRVRARLPVRVAGDPRGSSARHRRAHLRLARARFRAVLDALAEHQPSLPAGARRRADRGVAGRADLGRAPATDGE